MNTKTDLLQEEKIKEYLIRKEEVGYSQQVIEQDKKILNEAINCLDLNHLNHDIIEEYINNKYYGYMIRYVRHTLNNYNDYLINNSIKATQYFKDDTFKFGNIYKNEFYGFLNSLDNNLSNATKYTVKLRINTFCKYLYDNNVSNLNGLTIDIVTDCLNYFINNSSRCYANSLSSSFRKFLNYLYEKEIISFNGFQAIPYLVKYGNSIPTTYSPNEINSVLNSIDRNTAIGKRDFLALTLLSYYGIRIGDVVMMKISSFDFINNRLTFIQHKTRKLIELPLNEIVKVAFIDYVKNARPNIKSDYVFLRFKTPHTTYVAGHFDKILSRYLESAKINTENKKRGPHTLRHSLASNLLENGASLKTVSLDLGHGYENSSKIYLSINSTKLKELCLGISKNIEENGDFNE